MNSKEITTTLIILTSLLVGLVLLAKFSKNKEGPKSLDSELTGTVALTNESNGLEDTSGTPTTVEDLSGFEKRAVIQNSQTSNQIQELQPNQKVNQVVESTNKMQKPPMLLKDNIDYRAVIETSMGNITFQLHEEETPITVNNFVYLAKSGFYDNLIFHRIIPDFMLQGGDPTGTGSGGPGYSFEDEIDSKRPMRRGALAMANAGPGTNGSQFFIVTKTETPWLVKKHTNFGQITEGLDVAMAIEKVKTGTNDKPVEDVIIKTIKIIELEK